MLRIGVIHLALALCPALAAMSSTDAAPPVKKLLVIGVDGMRPDAMEAANTPAMHSLIADGCYSNDAACEDLTFSGPNWATILHGVHRDKHNVTSNDYSDSRLALYPDFLEYLEWHDPSLVTVRITTWDQMHAHQPTGADIDIFHNHESDGDAKAAVDAAQLLAGAHLLYRVDVDAMFVYFADVDEAGHAHGFSPTSAKYLEKIADTDARIGQILSAIRSRPSYPLEDWLVILTSDHGGAPDGGHRGNTPEKRRVPFIVSGPSAVKGTLFPQPKAVDMCKTALTFMGVPIPADIDGRAVGLKPSPRAQTRPGLNLIFNGDAEYDRGFSGSEPDQYVSGWVDPGPDQMSSIIYGAPHFPGAASPGPTRRGQAFFNGGLSRVSALTQAIDVSALGVQLDGGGLRFVLSGWLGGCGSKNDNASLRVRFKDVSGVVLGQAIVGPVSAAERGNMTGLLYRDSQGLVPVGTRTVEVLLTCTRASGGSNQGCADNLSLVLLDRALAGAPGAVGPFGGLGYSAEQGIDAEGLQRSQEGDFAGSGGALENR